MIYMKHFLFDCNFDIDLEDNHLRSFFYSYEENDKLMSYLWMPASHACATAKTAVSRKTIPENAGMRFLDFFILFLSNNVAAMLDMLPWRQLLSVLFAYAQFPEKFRKYGWTFLLHYSAHYFGTVVVGEREHLLHRFRWTAFQVVCTEINIIDTGRNKGRILLWKILNVVLQKADYKLRINRIRNGNIKCTLIIK